MWSPGLGELLIILVIVLVIFGAGKLPQVGRSLGDAISEFKEGVKPKEEETDKTNQASQDKSGE
ncbi:MAG TPA: twin-arginine translocase TatA/TatE family subunit [Candidatus Hydrogenedentes bacterium]|nr:twin-arginine translocase TatA/TatE family subunit [Candidatus Hydrogenedentota bacterium]HPG67802.1 twin-arginine translocase TatA/TatE family subunit [Candidatus Hydrogenedentota bacterium]